MMLLLRVNQDNLTEHEGFFEELQRELTEAPKDRLDQYPLVVTEPEAAQEYKGIPCFMAVYDKLGTSLSGDVVYSEANLETAQYIARCYKRKIDIPNIMLTTKRTFLRETFEDDYPLLSNLYRQCESDSFLEPLYEEEKERDYLRDYKKHVYEFFDYGMWGVFDKETGEIIGRAGLEPHPDGIELGYLIAPCRRGQGLAYEVCSGIIEKAKEEYELPELICRIEAGNGPSIALAKKLGFVHVAEKDDEKFLYFLLNF